MKTGNILSAKGLSLVLTACSSSPATPDQAQAAAPPPTQASAAPAPTTAGGKTFSEQELEQLVAPIALHPDALFTQILMASTYPLEVVAADRWVKANAGLKGQALEDALQGQPWDPSVKSLAVFPQVLAMMSEKIDWTQKLGDAFLAQQKDVLAAAQTLRSRAAAAGTLKNTEQQRVVTEQVESKTVIQIVPANPEVVYVPTYNPTVVYGAWPYAAYPPYYYYPPGYAAGAAVGAALWGDCDWDTATSTSTPTATTPSIAPMSRIATGRTMPPTAARSPTVTAASRSNTDVGARQPIARCANNFAAGRTPAAAPSSVAR